MMMASIGMMRAIHRHKERVFTDRKDHHWDKRKLAGAPEGSADFETNQLFSPKFGKRPRHCLARRFAGRAQTFRIP
jgi:hypothetical protein